MDKAVSGMKNRFQINGIRLYTDLIHVIQADACKTGLPFTPLYQTLASRRMNMMFMNRDTTGDLFYTSGVIGQKAVPAISENWDSRSDIAVISVFPHHYQMRFLAVLMTAVGQSGFPVYEMASSNAMLTFIIDHHDSDGFMDMLRNCFDQPDVQIWIEHEEHRDETFRFVKARYPQTHASYEEEKIKTYGIDLQPDLTMARHLVPARDSSLLGEKITIAARENETFFFVSGHTTAEQQFCFYVVTENPFESDDSLNMPVDLIRFYGPHFGDRHSIISRVLTCLEQHHIPVLQTGCTGASVGMVLEQGTGEKAKKALFDVFEKP